MKFLKIATFLFFAGVLGASAQLPAKRTMQKKSKAEVVEAKGEADDAAAAQDVETVRSAAARARADRMRTAEGGAVAGNRLTGAGAAAKDAKDVKDAKGANMPKATPAPPVNNQKKAEEEPAKPAPPKAAPGNRPGAAAAKPNLTGVSVREFPTAATMPDDAAWRRDVYRTLDLTKEENAVLYFPVVPTNGRQNLFVYLFRQILRGNIKAYEYTLDANEHFDEEHQLRGKKIMDTHNIYYENNDGKIRVNDADLPSEDVKLYFVKESVYYDQHTASFRTKVTAICPVMVSGMSDFGEEESQRVPLFWVNYEEAAPYLAKLSLMGSSMNNAAVISADDYFTMNRYVGDIYKTTNLQDKIIAQYAEGEEEQIAERKRIESELGNFEKHVWGHEPERLLDAYGNPVLDQFGKAITYNDEGQLVDSKGRHIALAVMGKDSVNVASETPDVDPLPAIVLVNERGFAVDAEGNPLLKEDGSPVEITDEYPTPEALGDGKKKAPAKSSTSSTARRTSTSSAAPSRRTTTTSSSKSTAPKSTAKSSAPKTKAPKASTSKSSSKSSNGGLSVRKERH